MAVGDRVRVELAKREYLGVVSVVHADPAGLENKIVPILGPAPDIPRIHPREIAFWRSLADYYLCTVGEVYKAAYPAGKPEKEPARPVKPKADTPTEPKPLNLRPEQEDADQAVRSAFSAGKTVLLQGGKAGSGRTEVYLRLAQEALSSGKSVLYLVPEIVLSRQLEEQVAAVIPSVHIYHSAITQARKRQVVKAVRESAATLVLGTRSALFLPHHNLGLIVLDEEQDISFKQDAPAPRYYAREAAILLAGIQGARVLLGSATPSLETIYNAQRGVYSRVVLRDTTGGEAVSFQVINLAAEAHKKGMSGSFSLQLLASMHSAVAAGQKILVVCRAKSDIPGITAELESIFGAAVRKMALATPASVKAQPAAVFPLTVMVQADGLLAKDDFRCDERAWQVLCLLRERCSPGGQLILQTWEAAHPLFQGFPQDPTQEMLAERRRFGYPPYTRLVHVVLKDANVKRLEYLSRALVRTLRQAVPSARWMGPYAPKQELVGKEHVRVLSATLQRDRQLIPAKHALARSLNDWAHENGYESHLHIDVDPV